MKKSLQRIFAGASALLLAAFAVPAQASHFQGSELTYSCLAPNMYGVTLKLYRDCSGAAAPTTAMLNIKSPGCNNGRSMSMNKVGTSTIGNMYCQQAGSPTCSSTGNANYEELIFTTTVTFSAAEAQCPDWELSWTECCRSSTGNITNAQSSNLYAEAFLKLGVQGTTTFNINNNSAQFQSLLAPYVNRNMPLVLSANAIDADGDSLVYSLKPALHNATTPVSYGPPASTSNILVNPLDSTQIAFIPAGQQNLSATFPIPSYFVDWTKPAPRYAVQSFVLDPTNGSLMFTPQAYFPNTSPAQGLNKYVVVVQVDEYRKINGVAVKIGHVRRDMFMTVVDCGPNQNPLIAAPVANGQPITPNNIIELRPGTPLNFTFAAGDNNQNDVLHLESDAAAILPGATFTKTTGSRPDGTVTWTPTAADVRSQVYYFRVMVQDNACPVKGQRIETFGVRVSNSGGVTGLSADQHRSLALVAFPSPFSQNLRFQVNLSTPGTNQEIVIYNTLGQQVDRISLKGLAAGKQTIAWYKAGKVANGQYIARLTDGKTVTETIQFTKAE